jgi:hypothetical protein
MAILCWKLPWIATGITDTTVVLRQKKPRLYFTLSLSVKWTCTVELNLYEYFVRLRQFIYLLKTWCCIYVCVMEGLSEPSISSFSSFFHPPFSSYLCLLYNVSFLLYSASPFLSWLTCFFKFSFLFQILVQNRWNLQRTLYPKLNLNPSIISYEILISILVIKVLMETFLDVINIYLNTLCNWFGNNKFASAVH